MIIVKLMGGLGNQLFQYAMGRCLSLRTGTKLLLDLSLYKDYKWHDYSLAPFGIQATVAEEADRLLMQKKQANLLNKILRKTTGKGRVVIQEKSILFDPAYKKIKSPAFIIGYWQSEEYFEEYADIIRKDLEIKEAPSETNKEILNEIRTRNSISLHIRRGNYVSVEEFNKVLGTCSLDYYRTAISYIEKRVKEPVFYVFSDDMEWARTHLTGHQQMEFIDVNDAKHDYEDIRLMTNCKHHIIANSTFSWWGAWLNPSKDKIVIAPSQWFAESDRNKQAAKLIPANWIRV